MQIQIIGSVLLLFLIAVPIHAAAGESTVANNARFSLIPSKFLTNSSLTYSRSNSLSTKSMKRIAPASALLGTIALGTGIPLTILGVRAIQRRSKYDEDANEPSDMGPEIITGVGIVSIIAGAFLITVAIIMAVKLARKWRSYSQKSQFQPLASTRLKMNTLGVGVIF